MKIILILSLLVFIGYTAFSQTIESDYNKYHKEIINAEKNVFIDNDSIQGLKIFKKTFDSYDFVFVDDCIEAFQLALHFKQEDYAMHFIKKALKNGFELKLLDELSLGCTCNYLKDFKKMVTIHKPFINKYKKVLEEYSKSCYRNYIERINKDLLIAVIKRHVRDQLFKNYHSELKFTAKEQREQYLIISDNNLRFIDSLAGKKIFLGERNLGIYTNKQAQSLNLPFKTIEHYLATILKYYGIKKKLKELFPQVPIISERDYYDKGPVYIMLYHNKRSYDVLSKFKDEAINEGFLHPREYSSLRYNKNGSQSAKLYLEPVYFNNKLLDTKELNERRDHLLLPSYEVDYYKHLFGHKHNLQLFLGCLMVHDKNILIISNKFKKVAAEKQKLDKQYSK